jgi:Na+:H+ antiporter, NhaA family
MHDELYAARGRLSVDGLAGHANAIGIDGERVRREITGAVHAERIARDEASARAAGITGTPAFFVNGVLHEGSFDAGSLVEALAATAPEAASEVP